MNNLLYSGGCRLIENNIEQILKANDISRLHVKDKALNRQTSFFSFLFDYQKDERLQEIDNVCRAILNDLVKSDTPLSCQSNEWQARRPAVKEFVKHVTGLVGKPAKDSYLKYLKEYVKSPETLEARLALKQGIAPKPLNQTSSGTYIFFNRKGEECGIFKPKNQEWGASGNPSWSIWGISMLGGNPQQIMGIEVEQSYRREKVAYKFSKQIDAGVAPTYTARFKHHIMDTSFFKNNNVPLKGSFQVFIPQVKAVADALKAQEKSGWQDRQLRELVEPKRCRNLGELIIKVVQFIIEFPYHLGVFLGLFTRPNDLFVHEIHRMGILDIRLLNCDRHLGNLLIDNHHQLYPIDHGLTLPGKATRLRFEWRQCPQASIPFSREELEIIENLNVCKDIELLKKNKINDPAVHKRLVISTRLLQSAARKGYTLAEIANLMVGHSKANGENTFFEKAIVPAVKSDFSNLEEVLESVLTRRPMMQQRAVSYKSQTAQNERVRKNIENDWQKVERQAKRKNHKEGTGIF